MPFEFSMRILTEASGSLVVSAGVMQLLKSKYEKVAFFRPIIDSNMQDDNDINFMSEYFSLDMKNEQTFALNIQEAKTLISEDKFHDLIEIVIKRAKTIGAKARIKVFILGC